MHQTLLTTKLYFPPARFSLVSRPRLMERLQIGLQGPLTLISAPAGYGKTTLMSEWRAGVGCDYTTAWLSLDGDDNDSTRFLTYIIAALASQKLGFGETTLALLQSSPPLSTQVILTSLINELETFDKTFSLILDDYHVITNHPIHEAVTYLLDHLPSQMHLVILTRADPPLPLSRLRGRNQLIEIRAADLCFTVEEAAAFLNQVMGLALSLDQVGALEQRTEGWVAGLQLAALSMRGRVDVQDFVSAFAGSHHYIGDYLVDEVLNRQPEAVREFLLRTSILDRLTAPLCNALTDQTDGQTVLDKLEHDNLFVVPLDDEQRWYRYHHLFADAIRNRLQQAQPNWLPNLHLRSSEWYEHHGFLAEAIRHALAGDDIQRAAQLVERNGLSLLTRGELVTLLGWIGAIEPLVCEHPWLCIYRSWALTLTGRLEGVEQWLQEAERAVPSQSSEVEVKDMLGHIAAIRTYVAVRKGDTLHATDFAHQALQYLPESDQVVRSAVTATLGRACWINGDLEGASRAFAEATRFGQAAGNLHLASGTTCSQADLLCELGRLHTAAATYREALQLATLPEGRHLPVAGRAYAGLSKVFYEWNDLEAVTRFADESIKFSQQFGSADSLAIGYVMIARLKQALGDPLSAQEAMQQATQLAREHHLWAVEASWVDAFRVRLWLTQGMDSIESEKILETVSHWVQMCELDIDDNVAYPREIEYLTSARVLLAKGEHHPALTLLVRLIRQAESTNRRGVLIELLLVQALAHQAMKDDHQAMLSLERAISLAEPEGYVRVFLDEGAAMAELLRHARSQGIAPLYIAKLLSAFEPFRDPDMELPPNQSIIEPLSERELEILRLVAEGKSNQQIADELTISRGTVKKHLNNIFGKLSAQSRIQCVVRARELKLL